MLNVDAMDVWLEVPVEKKKKPKNTTGCRANNVKKLLEEIIKEISSAYSFYCNQNYREDGPKDIYPRLTFKQLGKRVQNNRQIANLSKSGSYRSAILRHQV